MGALYSAGDPAAALYLVRAGALAAFRDGGGGPALLGMIRPGELAGEQALLAGTPRSSTVAALRDGELAALPADALFRAARRQPEVMAELARLLIRRARTAGLETPHARPRVFALVALSPRAAARAWAERLAAGMRAQGRSVALLGAAAAGQSAA